MRQPIIYGIVVAAAVFFVGWTTGMGGDFLPNLGFSILMGVLAAACFVAVVRFSRK
ncbi:MAG: hypothetical protein AAF401_01525 [Pseudomonadota bacterium]